MPFIYMLHCADGSYYVSSTRGTLDGRIAEHNNRRFRGYTSTRLPVTLVWSEEFQRVSDAIAVERRLKGWSRAKKQALIEGDFARVRRLASRARRSSSFETAAPRPPQDEERD